jgi:uncharacterized membrane protein
MGKPSGFLVASFFFLILSSAPVDAARVNRHEANIAADLSTNAVAKVDWHVFSTHEENCARWQQEFAQRSVQVQQLSAQLNAGEGGQLKTAQVVLRLRSMTRVYERAARAECTWITERDMDTDALRTTVDQNLGENPCLPQAQALLTHEFETQQEQITAMQLATNFLITRQCTAEDAERIQQEMQESQGETEEMTVDEQLAAANEDADSVTDELVEGLMNEEPSLLQVADSAQFIADLQALVGLVAMLLIWAVICIVFLPVIIMVIGAVLCTLSWVIRRLLGGRWSNTNLSSCMNWWAHQTQLIFAPGNELITAGACLLAGYFGAIPHLSHFGIYIHR